jgi:hypothetical protein
VGLRTGLDTEVRRKILSPLPGIEPRSPGRPARSQALYATTILYNNFISTVLIKYDSVLRYVGPMSRPGDWLFCFLFGRSWVKISAQRPAMLAEVSCSIPQPLIANVEVIR